MITLFFIGVVALLVVSVVFAPFEAPGWWAGWFGPRDALDKDDLAAYVQPTPAPASRAEHFLIYLSGVGAISGESLPFQEITFLDVLDERLPDAVLVRDVFPYSVTNKGLNGQRAFAWLWRRLERMRLERRENLLSYIINARNLFQVAVSADPRYGPFYNLGMAQEIVRGLIRHGYPLGSGKPVTLIGSSGGGQIAVGAATFLYGMLNAPIRVISIGGVMSDDPGLDSLVHLYHFYGDSDVIQKVGFISYPGRWPWVVYSPWNRARAEGRMTIQSVGSMTHNSAGSYFDPDVRLPNGQTHLEYMVQTVLGVLTEARLVEDPSGEVGEAG